MVVITIDDVKVEAIAGTFVLEAALKNGIYIPHLCYHPNLPPGESCRLCVVDLEGEENPVASCTLEVREGLVIHTKSKRLIQLRALALELLLAGHPEECTTCPKYGNCELQTLIQYIGPRTGRLRLRTKGFKLRDSEPLLEHEMNRCVLCGRCVRACNDLRGAEVLQYQKRDLEHYVGTVGDKLLSESGCRFCGACAEVCPTGTIRDKKRKTVTNWSREEEIVPCKAICPAGIDIPRYIRLVKEGSYDEAAAVIREKVPFPKALGYICNHECETTCKRGDLGAPISIKNLKRIAAELDSGLIWRPASKQLPDTGKHVCVVGAGPAGLTAAYYLRKQGHHVTVKEALPEAGGMMRYGIPAYRLPSEVIEEELKVITDTGVRLEYNARVERPSELLQLYDAVLLAMGTHKGIRLPIKGAELDNVQVNIEFLRRVRTGEDVQVGARVVVLGGGNVAFDCARTAVRLGAAEVHLACLESREAMPADEEEITQALEEGIHIHPGRSFEEITGESYATGITLSIIESFSLVDGKAIFTKVPDSDYHVTADTIIFAVGQRTDLDDAAGIPLTAPGRLAIKSNSLSTEVNGIFAAGDMVYGTKSVIQAIASGRLAAEEIDRYLGGDGEISEILAPVKESESHIGRMDNFAALPRAVSQITAPEERMSGFELVDTGLCEADACGEAKRCLQCDLRLKLKRPRLWADYSNQKEAQ